MNDSRIGRVVALCIICVASFWASPVSASAPCEAAQFGVERVTALDLDTSPDGRRLLATVLGELYEIPIEGGRGSLLSGGEMWKSSPRYSPDGKHIAFLSLDSGQHDPELWIVPLSARATQYALAAHVREFSWAANDRLIYRTVDNRIVEASLKGGSRGILHHPHLTGGPASNRGEELLYITEFAFLMRGNSKGRAVPILRVPAGSEHIAGPLFSPDGRWISFVQSSISESGAMARPWLRLLDVRSGEVHPIDASYDGIADRMGLAPLNAAFTPDSRSLVFASNGGILRYDIPTRRLHKIPFNVPVRSCAGLAAQPSADAGDDFVHLRSLRWANRALGQPDRAAFGAFGRIWLADLKANRLASPCGTGGSRFSPAISPDGSKLLFVERERSGRWHLKLAVIAKSRCNARILLDSAAQISSPSWSRDGRKIAVLRQVQERSSGDVRKEDARRREILTIDPASGFSRRLGELLVPYLGLYRVEPPLVFSEDGKRLFVLSTSVDRSHQQLRSIDLRSRSTRVHKIFPSTAGEVIPSPDGELMLVSRRDGIWLSRLGSGQADMMFDFADEQNVRLDGNDGQWPMWLDNRRVSWTRGTKVIEADLETGGLSEHGEVHLSLPTAKPGSSFAIANARIITLDDEIVFERGTVLVSQGRILWVGASDDARTFGGIPTIDGSGYTIVPGYIDTHAHPHGTPQRDYLTPGSANYRSFLAYGVTSIFDPSYTSAHVFAASDALALGDLVGPRLFSTGTILFGRLRRGGSSWGITEYFDATDRGDAQREVKRLHDAGAIMVKSYLQSNRTQRQWTVDAARDLGMGVTVHLESDYYDAIAPVRDGVTSLEHFVPDRPLHEDVTKLLKLSGVSITPNLRMHAGAKNSEVSLFGPKGYQPDPKFLAFHPAEEAKRFGPGRDGEIDPSSSWLRLANSRQSLLGMLEAGIPFDAGSHGEHGYKFHWELWMMEWLGFPPEDVLKASSLNGARKLGLAADLGSIEAGKLADFVVLRDNPLENIRATANVRFVVKNGVIYDGDSLVQLSPARAAEQE